jgi:hypothetical protein
MAVQPNVDTECLLLGEFVDDAGGAKSQTAAAEPGSAAAWRDVVRRVTVETGVPRFKLDEVVERVLGATGKGIEDLLRQLIRMILREYRPDPPPQPGVKPGQAIIPLCFPNKAKPAKGQDSSSQFRQSNLNKVLPVLYTLSRKGESRKDLPP